MWVRSLLSPPPHLTTASLAVLLAAIACTLPARADWLPGGSAISIPTGQLIPQQATVPDGLGGALVFWTSTDAARGPHVRMTHVRIDGGFVTGWADSGRFLFVTPTRDLQLGAAADGEGGAFVAVTAAFLGAPAAWQHILVQRVTKEGGVNPGWPAAGLTVCGVGGSKLPQVEPDAMGGLLLMWLDRRNGTTSDVYASRVLPSGIVAPGWPQDGFPVRTESAVYSLFQLRNAGDLVADGNGGCFVAWQDSTSGVFDAYVQHLDADGAPAPRWAPGGRRVSSIGSEKNFAGIVTDDAGGVIAGWMDYSDLQGRFLRIQSDGTDAPSWSPEGERICPGLLYERPLMMAADGAGGAVVALGQLDDTFLPLTEQITACRITSEGRLAPGWRAGNLKLEAYNSALTPVPSVRGIVLGDGASAYVTWLAPSFSPRPDTLFARRVTGDGRLSPDWPLARLMVSSSEDIADVECVSDGHGGALVTWQRTQGPIRQEIMGYRLAPDANPVTDVEPSRPATTGLELATYPNPFGATLNLRLTTPAAGTLVVDVLDTGGRRVRELARGHFEPGMHHMSWDGRDERGERRAAGLYWIRTRGPGGVTSRRVILLP